MYHLRRLIRDSGVGVEYGLRSVTCALGENLEPLMDEVLQSKCPEDGQNLLMYAASEGNEAWFLRLVGDIRSRLGVCALVKELREIDIDGAPILFHAASCRREHSCFRTAYDLIYTVLGKGGLMEQVEAVDGLGRGILMHAARSAHVETFKEVFDVCEKKAALMIPSSKVHDITAADIDELSKFIRDSGPQDFCEYCRDLASNLDRADELQKVFEDNYREDKPRQLLEGTDHVGMNCLHHAAEAGCCDVLKEVIEKYEAWTSWTPNGEAKTWGRALLLAAAAKRGDQDALYHVLLAIETGVFKLVKKDGAASFILAEEGNDAATSSSGGEKTKEEVKRSEERKSTDGESQEESTTAGADAMGSAGAAEIPSGRSVKEVVEKIDAARVSLFSYAIISGQTKAVEFVFDLVVKLFGKKHDTTWRILSGHDNKSGSSSLTCAASTSMESDCNGRTMFDKVYTLLKKVSTEKQLREELSGQRPDPRGTPKISPLVGAAFSSNWVLFRQVYDSFETLSGNYWWRCMVMRQIPPSVPSRQRSVVNLKELHACHDDNPSLITRGAWSIPAVMWSDIVEAFKRAQPDNPSSTGEMASVSGETSFPSWREDFKAYSRRAVKVAAERGTFTALRDLVKEGFPLHDDHIPALLESIGDHEQDIIEIILYAVANASNPFVMGAMVSRTLRRSEVDHPMHHKGLRRLQGIVDSFTNELLEKLPHTVRGMGVALLGGHQPIFYGHGLQQGKRHRLGNLAGFIVVEMKCNSLRHDGPEVVDPLRRALDRGSQGLDFLNSPLVLDYVHVKFTGTLPKWTSRNPFQPTVNEGFYKYDDFDKYDLRDVLLAPAKPVAVANTANDEDGQDDKNVETAVEKAAREAAEKEGFLSMAFLLRFLQGWDHGCKAVRNIPSLWFPAKSAASIAGRPNSCQLMIPHLTMLPGLQFSLAGILGKPGTFYKVPVMRFVFEIFSYLVMLVLFCSSVLLKQHDVVPPDEAIFYVYAAGMLWREVLEFRDGLPARRHPASKHQDGTPPKVLSEPRLSDIGAGSRFNRMVSAFTRYVFFDTWNFLDTSTIVCILVAFIFRMLALNDDFFLFHAQFFLALSAPLLFWRLLVLSQIDSTLGPMTQVIWRMMSHTLRFSAFIAMVMLSFALAFQAVFHTCDPKANDSIPEGFEYCALHDAFGSFGDSFVTVFSSALGGPDFDLFDDLGDGCRCDLPSGARIAGISLMVVYMITMSVVLLNLLIAVLSTAHDEVYANAEKEFHLARARLIYQSARVVTRRRPPPPLNLIKVVLGLLVDTGTELWRGCLWIQGWTASRRNNEAATDAGEQYRKRAKKLEPFSTTSRWKNCDDHIQELEFALTLGGTAVGLSTVLWVLSVPWVAWCMLRSVRPPEDVRHRASSSTEKPANGSRPAGCQDDNNHHNNNGGKNTGAPGSSRWNCCLRRKKRDGGSTPPGGQDDSNTGNNIDDRANQHLGYFLRIMSAAKSLVGLVLATICAVGLCILYIAGSFILWVLGWGMLVRKLVAELWEWEDSQTEYGVAPPDAMPGQEGGDHWERAWELARRRNQGVREDYGPARFHFGPFYVVPFLKSLTGLESQHLARLTKERDERSMFEQELIEVDRTLAGAHIDLEHLGAKAKSRSKKAYQNRLTRVFGGSSDRDFRGSAAPTPASAPAPALASPAPAVVSPAAAIESTDPAVASPAPAVESPAPGVTAATTEAGDHGSGDPLLTGGGPQPGGEGHLPSEDAARPGAHTPVTNDDSTPASAPAPAVASPAPAVASPAPAVASPAPAVASPAPGVTAATTEAGDHGSGDPLLTGGGPQPGGEGHLPSEDAARPEAHTPVTNDDSTPASAPAPAVANPAPAVASPAPAVASPAPAVESPAPGVTAATTEAGDHGSDDPLLTRGVPQPEGEGHLPSEDAARPGAHTPVTNDDSKPIYRAGVVGSDGLGGTASIEDDIIDKLARELLDLLKKRKGEKQSRADDTTGES
eukprot:g13587.t1